MKKCIIVLRGGPSSEHDVSMKTGRAVLDELSTVGNFTTKDIFIDKKASWLHNGIEMNPQIACQDADCIFNALHGEYGEDGQVQRLLEKIGLPFTGPKSLGAALSMHKAKTKEIYRKYGIKTPIHKIISRPETKEGIEFQASLIFKTFPMPLIIKPIGLGSSVGISIARDFISLVNALKSLYARYEKLLIEEYIHGREATVGVIEKFRNQPVYALLPVEIRPPSTCQFFDYEAKYSGNTEEICPGNFSANDSGAMQDAAALAHEVLGLRHYSRTDFILHTRRGIYALETNSLPGLTRESLLPKSFEPVGSSYGEFLQHILNLAMEN